MEKEVSQITKGSDRATTRKKKTYWAVTGGGKIKNLTTRKTERRKTELEGGQFGRESESGGNYQKLLHCGGREKKKKRGPESQRTGRDRLLGERSEKK